MNIPLTLRRRILLLLIIWPVLSLAHDKPTGPSFPSRVPPWLYEEGGEFELTSHLGNSVTEKSFAGKYLFIYFGYTHCADACPLSLNKMVLALRAIGSKADQVQPLFITTDPRRDTAEVLADFAPRFHPKLVGLTGDKHAIFRATKTYGVRYFSGRIDGRYEVGHTDNLFLMGPDGLLKGFYPTDTDTSNLAEALKKVIQ